MLLPSRCSFRCPETSAVSALQTTLRVNDVNVRVHRAGNGDPVLFSTVPPRIGMAALLRSVSKDAALIVPSIPLDGSTTPSGSSTFPIWQLLSRLLEQQNLTNVNVIGTSLADGSPLKCSSETDARQERDAARAAGIASWACRAATTSSGTEEGA